MLKKGKNCTFGTLRFTPNCVFNTNSVQIVRYFLAIDGLLRCCTVRYGTLENSYKNGLPNVFYIKNVSILLAHNRSEKARLVLENVKILEERAFLFYFDSMVGTIKLK
jgi:hypothetical protein